MPQNEKSNDKCGINNTIGNTISSNSSNSARMHLWTLKSVGKI